MEIYALALALTPLGTIQVHNPNLFDEPSPMEINVARHGGSLFE